MNAILSTEDHGLNDNGFLIRNYWYWNNIFKVLRGKNCQTRIQYIEKKSLRNEIQISSLSGEGNLREFITSKFVPKEMLQEILQTQET